MSAKGGLGRGLDHLFSGNQEVIKEASTSDIKNISIAQLKAGIHQPRKKFTEDSLEELSTSIKNQGIIQPLLVRAISGKTGVDAQYEIIAGERRFRAAKLVQITEIPVIIRDYTDAEAMTIALIENLQREDLNAIEEAEAYYSLKEVHKLSQEDLAEKLGKSRPSVANALRLLSLPSYIKESIISDAISASHGRCLLAINDEKEQKILFDAAISQTLNVREMEKAAEEWKLNASLPNYIYGNETAKNTVDTAKKAGKNETIMSELIQNINAKLKDKFYKKASIQGNEKKGTIKINYKSPEELQYILDALSIEENI